jgi:hypothetical protein
MVIVNREAPLGENHRLRGWLAVKANSPRFNTIPVHVWFVRIAAIVIFWVNQ